MVAFRKVTVFGYTVVSLLFHCTEELVMIIQIRHDARDFKCVAQEPQPLKTFTFKKIVHIPAYLVYFCFINCQEDVLEAVPALF